MNRTTRMNKFLMEPPLECYKLRLLGIFSSLTLVLSLVFNTLLIIIFLKHKALRKNLLNTFVFAMTVLNLIGSILEFSFVIPSNFACK